MNLRLAVSEIYRLVLEGNGPDRPHCLRRREPPGRPVAGA